MAGLAKGTMGRNAPWYGTLEHLRQVDPALALIYEGYWSLRDKQGRLAKYVPNPVQDLFFQAIYEMRLAGRPVMLLILKARQMGISTAVAAYFMSWMKLLDGLAGTVVSRNKDDAKEMFRQKYQQFAKGEVERNPKAFDSKALKATSGTLKRRDNESQIRVVASTDGSALGSTAQLVHLSEYPHFKEPEATFAAIKPSFPEIAAPGVALIVESTGALPDDDFSKKYWSARDIEDAGGVPAFKPVFWNWLLMPDYTVEVGEAESRELMASLAEDEVVLASEHHATPGQIMWRRQQIALYGLTKFSQQYPLTEEEAFGAGQRSVFDVEAMDFFDRHCVRDPELEMEIDLLPGSRVKTDIQGRGRFHVFLPPRDGRKYTISADVQTIVSKGAAHQPETISDTGAIVWDDETGDICATWQGDINPWEFATTMAAMGYYYKTATLWPEINHSGQTVVNRLVNELSYPNMGRRAMNHKGRFGGMTDQIGWITNHQTRDPGIDLLQFAVQRRIISVPCKRVLEQMGNFVRKAGGRRQAKNRYTRDEMVICAMIGVSVLNHQAWVQRTAENIRSYMEWKRETVVPTGFKENGSMWRLTTAPIKGEIRRSPILKMLAGR